MARPRKYNITIPGLSCYTDARTKKIYWRYKHPVTGKFHGLGDNPEEARTIAIDANMRLAEQQMVNLIKIRNEISREVNQGITANAWIQRYRQIQQDRVKAGEIKPDTARGREPALRAFISQCGIRPLPEVGARDIASILETYIEKGQGRMAQVVRATLSDVFKEAQHAGEVPAGYNPATATKQPRAKVTRQRLSFDEWKAIYTEAQNLPVYIARAMLLAIITGQRVGDISTLKFSDIWEDRLHIKQEKTGAKVAIPLSLKCEALGISLRDVIADCRDSVLSQWILHHHRSRRNCARGGPVTKGTLSCGFATARDKTGLVWDGNTPPSFHEQRSLSERLYSDQGINTQILLGHKTSVMTDKYHDDRGKDWKEVSV
ncbi:phage integrase Arm DNA-binding domain-containing protein [Rahnella sp. ChDrAdgB13]|uniref:phage integrase Arm DNA-binding domain-containing protein n=1 Tax=Rahnella sp. ChDrAdgB13 TaxID=1850581 RepID=UPI001AD886C2|nr:phage integrase Arm DNA-binding domain-containing protein [Rahnella sp. ChDrAdgB13]